MAEEGCIIDAKFFNLDIENLLTVGKFSLDQANFSTINVEGQGTIGGGITVDQDTFVVNSTTNKVGIGLSSPLHTLDVNGDINISSGNTLRIGGTEAVFSNWSVDGSDIYRSSNVGIGTNSPDNLLHLLSTSTQLKISYDNTNFSTVNVSSNSDTTFATAESGVFNFSDNLNANAGLDVSGGALTITNQAITQTTGGNVTLAGAVEITNNTATTSTTTGALKVVGGISTQSDLFVGDDLIIGDDISLKSDSSVLKFGDDEEITLTHQHNEGLILNKNLSLKSDNSVLKFGDDEEVILTHIHNSGLSLNKNLTLNGLTIVSSQTVNMGNNKIENVTDPTSAQDAATKAYVDATAEGLHIQEACRLATTQNITLNGTQTIDGVSAVANDRILVKDQSTQSQNGVYIVVSGGSWTRSTDFDEPNEIKAGDFVFVTEGTINASHGYVMTQTATIDIGTTDITWTQFSGAGQIIDGNGINKNGQELSLDLKSNGGLVFESTELAVDLGASSITGTLAISDGGTGSTTLNDLITLGTHTTGNYVSTITGGTGITSTAATSGEGTTHSLSIDATQTQITSVGTLDGGSITSNFGNINIGSSTITTTGAISGGTLTGTLSTAAQTNITSVGQLTSLGVTDSIEITGSENVVGLTINNTNTSRDSIIKLKSFSIPRFIMGIDGSDNDNFKISTDSSELSVLTKLTILYSNGNIGIGTDNPSQKLDINGNINIYGIISGDTVIGEDINDSLIINSKAIFTNEITGTLSTAAQTNITSVGILDGGSITSNFGNINIGSSTITTTGAISGGTLTGTLSTAAQTNITSVGILDGGSITSNFGNINIGSSTITTTGAISGGTLTGTLSTAAQTNITSVGILDGGSITSNFGNINIGSSTITTTGAISGGTLTGTLSTAAQTNITSVGILDGGSITSNFGNINIGSSTITTTGAISGGTLTGTLSTAAQTNITSVGTLDGGSITSNFGNINIGSSTITTTGAISGGTLTGTLSTAAQTNITSVGTLDGGSITSNFGNINIGSSTITTTGAISGGTLTGTLSTAAQTNITSVGTLDGGSITSNFGNINIGSSTITTTGTLGCGVLTVATGSSIGTLALSNGSITDSNGSISFGNENLTTTGNVGIGTTSPQSSLHVAGARLNTPTVAGIHLGMGGADAAIEIVAASTTNNSFIDFTKPNSDFRGRIIYNHTNNGTDSMGFFTSAAERMRIDSAGNVGIGTTTPAVPLHINSSDSGDVNMLMIQSQWIGENLGPAICFVRGTSILSRIRGIDQPSWGGGLTFETINNPGSSQGSTATTTERMRIDQGGNVGIGQTIPVEKLDVNGGIRIGNASNTNDGTIKYNNNDFQGRKNGSWVSLTDLNVIKEYISGFCDGQTVSLKSGGNLTFQNVTAYQGLSTTFTDITGSTISYLPPAGTTLVVYEFIFSFAHGGGTAGFIGSFKFYIDNVEQTGIRLGPSGKEWTADRIIMKVPIRITGTTSSSDITLDSWNASKTIKIMGREWGSGDWDTDIHRSIWFSGSNSAANQFNKPTVTIIAK